MKRSRVALVAAGILLLFWAIVFLRSRGQSVRASVLKDTPAITGLIAAPGRVEAISEEIRVSSELSGRLKKVYVEEGDRVYRKGIDALQRAERQMTVLRPDLSYLG